MEKAYKIVRAQLGAWKISTLNMCEKCSKPFKSEQKCSKPFKSEQKCQKLHKKGKQL